MYKLSDVISIRVPRELKEKMRKYRVDWSKEVRGFLEERVRVLELLEVLDDVGKKVGKRRIRVDSVKLIRETREER